MNIFIDINHPAHVHYFKNLIKIMEKRGHRFLIISRDKEIEHYLLNVYDIPFIDRGKGSNTITGKFFYFFKAIFFIYKKAKKFNPDIMISFGTPYPAIVSKLLGKPHFSFNDTEHAKLHHLLTDPFSETILTPYCYNKDLGEKHIKFNGFMELCYLHKNYFHPNSSIFKHLGIQVGEKYIIIRFVSWNASHDIGHSGLTLEGKRKIVKTLSKNYQVFISSEDKLPEDLKKYQIVIPPEKMHDVLYYATLFLGEGATMASECAMIGTPAIYINTLTAGTLEEQEKNGLIFSFRSDIGVLDKAKELLEIPDITFIWKKRILKFMQDKIDINQFMVWFIENYPQSVTIMKENPEFQNRFK